MNHKTGINSGSSNNTSVPSDKVSERGNYSIHDNKGAFNNTGSLLISPRPANNQNFDTQPAAQQRTVFTQISKSKDSKYMYGDLQNKLECNLNRHFRRRAILYDSLYRAFGEERRRIESKVYERESRIVRNLKQRVVTELKKKSRQRYIYIFYRFINFNF